MLAKILRLAGKVPVHERKGLPGTEKSVWVKRDVACLCPAATALPRAREIEPGYYRFGEISERQFDGLDFVGAMAKVRALARVKPYRSARGPNMLRHLDRDSRVASQVYGPLVCAELAQDLAREDTLERAEVLCLAGEFEVFLRLRDAFALGAQWGVIVFGSEWPATVTGRVSSTGPNLASLARPRVA